MKRVFLFIATNLAVMLTLGIIVNIFGLNRYLTPYGIDYTALMGFSLVIGFGGAFISLAMSKFIAKRTMGLKLIDGTEGATERWIFDTIAQYANQANIDMPEVAIYNSPEMNAFATGPSKNNSLVAVSTGLINSMSRQEVSAVLGHEISHVANGDMVTMTLLQGVVNTFVIFISRILAHAVEGFFNKSVHDTRPSWAFPILSIFFDLIFGVFASMIVAAYSRRREFAADKGGAHLAGRQSMINALSKLGHQGDSNLAANLKAFGITGSKSKFLALLSTHPPIELRIKTLEHIEA